MLPTDESGFASPLPAPDSPLAAPPAPAAEETPVAGKPVVGSWQLQAIKPSSVMTATAAPAGYRVAFSRTGVVRVMGDCKSGRGVYTRGPGEALSINITYNDVRCVPESLADPFARALTEVTAYRFEGDKLVLAYGAQGGEMVLGRTAQMSAFGAPFLSWPNLQNSTYLVPGVPAGDNQAPMVDGEFRAFQSAAGSAAGDPAGDTVAATPTPTPSEFVVSLSTMHAYGVLVTPSPEEIAADPEITAEVSADSVVVLVVEDGESAGSEAGPISYLAPVLNGGGLALPLPLEALGESVFVRDLRLDDTRLTVEFDQGAASLRRVYKFDGDRFVQESEEALPVAAPKARLDLPAQILTLGQAVANAGAGVGEAAMTGAIAAGEVHPYRLALQAGQQLSVTIQSPFDHVWLSIFGRDDHTVLRSIRSDTVQWAGAVPSAQEYLISAVAPGSASPYTLTIQVTNGPAATDPATTGQAATATPAATPPPSPVYLVIDGAAAAGAPVLEALQRRNVTAAFFVEAGRSAEQSQAAQAAVAAGHGLGIIAGPITALTSDGRDALFAEVSAARTALGSGDQSGVSAACLRLPTAAGDGYTRAAAAELGFDVVQWDIDADGLAADALLGRLFPGAVVRLAGDDPAALAATLDALLITLNGGGYIVQPICR